MHPYLDNVDLFFDTSTSLIKIRTGLSASDQAKAETTRELLHWSEPEVVLRRSMQAMAQHYAIEHNTNIDQISYEDTLTYIPGSL